MTTAFAQDGTYAFLFVGNTKKWKTLSQMLPGPFPAGKTFSLSGFVKAVKAKDGGTIRLTALVAFPDGSYLQYILPFPGGTYDWTYKSGWFTVDKPIARVDVRAVAGYQSGTIYVDTVNFTDQPPLTKSEVIQLTPQPVATYEIK